MQSASEADADVTLPTVLVYRAGDLETTWVRFDFELEGQRVASGEAGRGAVEEVLVQCVVPSSARADARFHADCSLRCATGLACSRDGPLWQGLEHERRFLIRMTASEVARSAAVSSSRTTLVCIFGYYTPPCCQLLLVQQRFSILTALSRERSGSTRSGSNGAGPLQSWLVMVAWRFFARECRVPPVPASCCTGSPAVCLPIGPVLRRSPPCASAPRCR